MDDKLFEKVKSLYEQNNKSPLFLKVADFYISSYEINKALLILESGMKTFPDHPLALILFAKANYMLGELEKADSLFKRAGSLLNSEQVYSYYKTHFDLPDKPASPFDNSRGKIFVDASADNEVQMKSEENENKVKPIEERLSEIAEKMMNTRITRNDNADPVETKNSNFNTDGNMLASETLAGIYLSQGQKGEAIKVYKLLIKRNPEKSLYYSQKIEEIKSQ